MPEIPPQADTPTVMDRAAYQASKAMLQARLSGDPHIGYAAMGRSAALAVAPVVAEHIARLIEAARPAKPPEADLQRHATLESRLAYNESARIARDAFAVAEPPGPDAPARASTPPYAPLTADPGVVGSKDDPRTVETPTALRERIEDAIRDSAFPGLTVQGAANAVMAAIGEASIPLAERGLVLVGADELEALRGRAEQAEAEAADLRADLERIRLTARATNGLYRSAEGDVTRVHALAENWKHVADRKNGPLRELLAALDVPADGEQTPETTEETDHA